jgi:hypothetical protein
LTRAHRSAIGVVLALPLLGGTAEGRVYMTQQKALEEAFPAPARFARRTLYLDADQARRASETAGAPVEARVVPYYVGDRDGKVTGYAYFDTHLVRTLAETVLVLLSSEGRIVRIDILSFEEPEDYLPPGRWLAQFPGRHDPDDLAAKGGVRSLTGATLSARAVTQAARRVLALHRLFVAPGEPPASGGAEAKP